jgi:hypothetical protein
LFITWHKFHELIFHSSDLKRKTAKPFWLDKPNDVQKMKGGFLVEKNYQYFYSFSQLVNFLKIKILNLATLENSHIFSKNIL